MSHYYIQAHNTISVIGYNATPLQTLCKYNNYTRDADLNE